MEKKETKKEGKALYGSTNKPLKRFQCIILLILSLFSATKKLYDLTFMVKKKWRVEERKRKKKAKTAEKGEIFLLKKALNYFSSSTRRK